MAEKRWQRTPPKREGLFLLRQRDAIKDTIYLVLLQNGEVSDDHDLSDRLFYQIPEDFNYWAGNTVEDLTNGTTEHGTMLNGEWLYVGQSRFDGRTDKILEEYGLEFPAAATPTCY